jgi:hypothetical protein
VAPKRFIFSARRDKELHLEASGTMAEEADAKQLVEGIEALRKQALDFLKDPQPQGKLPAEGRDVITGALKGATVVAKDKNVTASMNVSAEALQVLLGWMKQLMIEENKGGWR